MPDVIIVGGGISGLATAFELYRLGVPFLLLESASRVGGVVLSEQVDGYTIDAGPEALLVHKPDAITLCRELGLADRLVPTKLPRLAFIQRAGTLHPLPAASVLGIPTRFGPFIRTGLFSWRGKARMGLELFVPPRRDDADESIGSFMTRRFGTEATTFLAEPLLAGIHAGDVDRLSMKALFPRFVEAERVHGSLLKAFRRPLPRPAPTSGTNPPKVDNGPFLSLPGGLSDMIRALVAALPAASIRLRSPVTGIVAGPSANVARDSQDTPTFRLQLATGETVEARSIVLAAPAYVAGRLLRGIDAEIASLCEGVRYVSSATVALAFPRTAVRHPLAGSGFVVPRGEGTGILAGSWMSSKWPHRAPADRVLLRAFVGGAREPEALEQSDADLVSRARAALGSVLGISGEPLLTRVYRWERANAQHEVGHLARMAEIDRRISEHPGLFVTGSGFRGVGIPDCIADGRAAARQAAEWLARCPVTLGPPVPHA